MYFGRVLAIVFLALGAGCASNFSSPGGDGPPPDGDSGTWVDGGGCPATPCPLGLICQGGLCLKDLGPCAADDDCQNDSFCEKGRCLPYGKPRKESDPGCKGAGFAAEKLEAPTVKCQWNGGAVLSSPVVADLDGDKKPEILFVTYSNPKGSLVAIRGDTCQQVFTTAGLAYYSQLAVADLTGDKVPEIIGVDSNNRVLIFDNKGKVLDISPFAAQTSATSVGRLGGGPAVANLDGKGPPEIIYGGMAIRYENNVVTPLYNVLLDGGHWGALTVVADVDLDGTPDIVGGNKILDGLTGADKTPPAVAAFRPGYVAVGDFDPTTKEPEIVLISSQNNQPGEIRIYHPKTGKVIFGPYTFGQKYGGPPTVADFDGDGKPEVGAAGYVGYAVFDPDCAVTPLPSFCAQPGVRWLKNTQDKSSGSTGSSVFDFNGDGAAEVVYRDECWLRVYDGKTGKVRFAQYITSGTALELPVIADVDNDNHAEIVVPAHTYSSGCGSETELGLPKGQPSSGIFVLQDPKNRWMPSRAIWNQHTYHITNINDDGTVPLKEANNWQTWNNYRQNVQGTLPGKAPGPDLTSGDHTAIDPASNCTSAWVLQAKICNRGAAKVAPGVWGTFFEGDPRKGGKSICTAQTKTSLAPGKCEAVKCTYSNPPSKTIDLWFAADADGSGAGKEQECKEKNNLLHLPKAVCNKIE